MNRLNLGTQLYKKAMLSKNNNIKKKYHALFMLHLKGYLLEKT